MDARLTPASELPSWIDRLGAAAWVCSPDQKILHLNPRAEELLGITDGEARGFPCHQVIGGRDKAGRRTCREQCEVICWARAGREVEPRQMQLQGASGETRWLRLLSIPLRMDSMDDPGLVECVLSEVRTHRMEEYLRHVIERHSRSDASGTRPALTPREDEIMKLLARDLDLPAIASALHVSYATIRNHVQHILAKFHVHSIAAAVAVDLLERPG